MGFHPTELIIIFVVALLIFGPKKLPEMGAQLGRSLNAFKKGLSEFNRSPLDDSFDLESFAAQQRSLKALEARRLELEILERELALKRAEAALNAVHRPGVAAYDAEDTFDEDYVEAGPVVEADSIAPKKTVDAVAASDEVAEAAKPEQEAKATGPAEETKAAKSVEEARAANPKTSVETE
jgi:sec-independent protein translocase protein TatA